MDNKKQVINITLYTLIVSVQFIRDKKLFTTSKKEIKMY